MSKLPVIKSQELLKALKKMGFFEFHQVGSHLQMKHADGRRATIPVHRGKDVPRGTLHAILKQIGVAGEELVQNL